MYFHRYYALPLVKITPHRTLNRYLTFIIYNDSQYVYLLRDILTDDSFVELNLFPSPLRLLHGKDFSPQYIQFIFRDSKPFEEMPSDASNVTTPPAKVQRKISMTTLH